MRENRPQRMGTLDILLAVLISAAPIAGIAGLVTGLIDMQLFDRTGPTNYHWYDGYYRVVGFFVSHTVYALIAILL